MARLSRVGEAATKEVSLSAAQIRSLSSVPLTLFPAPGASRLVVVEHLIAHFVPGSILFDATAINLKYVGAANALTGVVNPSSATPVLLYKALSPGSPNVLTNAAVQIVADIDGAGNGTLWLSVRYQVVSIK